MVDSSHEGVRKPNPVIYFTALERLGVSNPAHAVFLDDFEGNVIAARNLGMHGIVVGDDPARRSTSSSPCSIASSASVATASASAFAWAS